ncbi:hypothetical protein [Streptomyces sp. CC224B]|uniref:hypothetical protein n=1 Tax=Streptomyces sp. CC224B TaxID=3044571 RepID=UPI0024A85151|nr:hypothetical protein [Streptomyces sp. CC224B]
MSDDEPTTTGGSARGGGTGTGATGTGGDVAAADVVSAPRRPWWHWRQLTRGRLRPAVAAALAGALLGGTGVAWQTRTGPFAGERACWGAFDEGDVADLFHGKRDIEAAEIPVTTSRSGSEGPSGRCQLTSPRGARITARLHRLDVRFGGAGDTWADEYLSARMTPLGGGVLGMVSDTRAWLAVPEGCVGRPSEDEGPLVVDMETGWTSYDDEVDTGERARLARAVVKLANDYMRDKGCTRALADPSDRLAAPARFLDERKDAICGVKGLRLHGGRKADGYRHPLVTRGAAPVRTCDRDVLFGHPSLRLMTVADPRLAALYRDLSFDGGRRRVTAVGDTKEYSRGRGFLRDDMALYQAECQTGQVTFLIRADDGDQAADIRALLPRYVAAEADRMGCGPLRLRMPA